MIWPLSPCLHAHPGALRPAGALWVYHRAGAGHAGPLRYTTHGTFRGPGFDLEVSEGTFRAYVASPESLFGAVAALVISLYDQLPILLFHAASLSFRHQAVWVLGPSGSGKSTLMRRHAHRAIGSNAMLAWPTRAGFRTCALPLTGHGDASVRPGTYSIAGALVLPRRAPRSAPDSSCPPARENAETSRTTSFTTLSSRVARLCASVATAEGHPMPLDRVVALALECPLRACTSQDSAGPTRNSTRRPSDGVRGVSAREYLAMR